MIESKTPLRVAAYVRVSTKLEEQEGSYDIQVEYFTEKINANPDMLLVGIYGDLGKSGLKMKGRDGLAQLMADCEAGKIDLILTKSISRFARNMADCAEMIRKLRELGVGIIFEKENINSKDAKCDLILNIFAALAQEESNSISQNSIRAHEQHAKEGRPFGNIAYGYGKKGKQRWMVLEQEAERVRLAFQMASDGDSYTKICKALDVLEERDGTEIKWSIRRIQYMLTNEVYMGDYYSHKRVSLVPGKSVVNDGYRDRYYIEDHHEPIVSRALFEWVQSVIERGLLYATRVYTAEEKSYLQKKEEFLKYGPVMA